MVEKIIDSYYLRANIRHRKASGAENVAWLAPQGTPFEVTDDTTSSTWTEGTYLKHGKHLDKGFVFHTVVRDPVPEVKEDLIRQCIYWYEKFERGNGKENEAPFKDYIADFWAALGSSRTGIDSTPWSAAFISYVIRKSGGYTGFKFSQLHAHYIHDAIKKRQLNKDAPFWGYKITEKKPELGDIICQWRINPINYDFAANSNDFFSHTDIVVRVKDGRAHTIGGNVNNSVDDKIFTLDANGFLPPQRNVFAILKNRR